MANFSSAEPPRRIVSLAPSTTEILFALGLGDRIAGVTSFCDYPEEAKAKPKIGGMSNPSLEAIVSLKPDLVVMTTDGNPKEVEERLHSLKIRTYVFTARRLNDLPNGIRSLGAAVGVSERADRLALEIEKAIRSITVQSSKFTVQSTRHKVLFIVWPEPLIVAGPGTAMDDAIRLLGHENVAGTAKASYPKYSIEEAIRQAPDILIIGKATGMDISALSQGILKKLASVPAVKNDRVFYVSDGLYRLGPRVVKGIEELAECLK
jgi:iron complex transport system substrate-binding protein